MLFTIVFLFLLAVHNFLVYDLSSIQSNMLIASKLVLFIAICIVGAVHGQQSVDFIMSARNLPNKDIFDGAPDPYVKVFYAEGSSDVYGLVGETERLANTNNPDFGDLFHMTFNSTANQRVKLEMWDEDVDQLNDYMGFVDVKLSDIVGASGILVKQILECDKDECGQLHITRRLNKEMSPNLDPRFLHPTNIVNWEPTKKFNA